MRYSTPTAASREENFGTAVLSRAFGVWTMAESGVTNVRASHLRRPRGRVSIKPKLSVEILRVFTTSSSQVRLAG